MTTTTKHMDPIAGSRLAGRHGSRQTRRQLLTVEDATDLEGCGKVVVDERCSTNTVLCLVRANYIYIYTGLLSLSQLQYTSNVIRLQSSYSVASSSE